MTWGIAVEWDEDGLECCKWHRFSTDLRAQFATEERAAEHAEWLLVSGASVDVIYTPRQFT